MLSAKSVADCRLRLFGFSLSPKHLEILRDTVTPEKLSLIWRESTRGPEPIGLLEQIKADSDEKVSSEPERVT